MMHAVLYVVTTVLLACGVFMAFVPMLPALSYMFVVALAYGLIGGFTGISGGHVVALLCITVVSIINDQTAGLLGAKYGGAHARSMLWGLLGAFVGLFTLPAFGSFIGLFLGVLISELYYKKHHQKALKAAGSALLGSAIGMGINIVLSMLFFGLFMAFTLR
jgi:uncharacterized protein YqgC (DUF456 family)